MDIEAKTLLTEEAKLLFIEWICRTRNRISLSRYVPRR